MSRRIDSTSGKDSGLHRFSHHAMACTWDLWIAHAAPLYARQAAQVVFDEIDRLEFELSRFIPSSDVSRINAQPPGVPLRIGPDCFECLSLADELHAATEEAFDVCVGAWVERSLGRVSVVDPPDSPENLSGSSEPPERPGIRIDRQSRSVARESADTLVDLGGIGKGFAIDRGVELLREWGIRRALLHSGQSTVYALADDGPPWRLAIRDPHLAGTRWNAVPLANQALAGSGRDHHGPHIIDPRSGLAVVGATAAWALADGAARADAWSTSLMVLGRSWLMNPGMPEGVSGCLADGSGPVVSPDWPPPIEG